MMLSMRLFDDASCSSTSAFDSSRRSLSLRKSYKSTRPAQNIPAAPFRCTLYVLHRHSALSCALLLLGAIRRQTLYKSIFLGHICIHACLYIYICALILFMQAYVRACVYIMYVFLCVYMYIGLYNA